MDFGGQTWEWKWLGLVCWALSGGVTDWAVLAKLAVSGVNWGGMGDPFIEGAGPSGHLIRDHFLEAQNGERDKEQREWLFVGGSGARMANITNRA